ncbi:iron(III) transport system substrate-binding protein [Nocardioides zeae]|uniref:Iron(III) transport system substrate-binding protein n=1 Tax=Nocardioides zeae TaxID=1457234 RepID=A0ACC6IJ22_9ACTN|nr:extracellular solute-binding protein [Nocardioides zeae]MDR6174668.1 iron(III) transport system substrate-binding protein [Nocardioides zeae]MDR6210738.1 iron(III) transport system substrate-binding protein [Nocardioides zeae]
MRNHWMKRVAQAATLAVAATTLVACGSDEPSSSLAEGDWDSVVSAAEDEGAVTIYSSQGSAQLEDLAAGFEEEYGIDVEIVRDLDSNLAPRFDTEIRTGSPTVDVFVSSTETIQQQYSDQGAFEKPIAPVFDDIDVMRDDYYFDVDATVITFAWNTDEYSGTIESYEDLLDPALKGKIGVPEPTVPAFVDFYLYLERLYGEDFSERLAAQEPKIYPGALPAAQALSSGEIAAAAYVEPQVDEQEAGAPVDWGFEQEQWSAMFYGAIAKDSPHPNAAQLLVDYMLSVEGQSRIARKAASIRPDVPGTVGTTETVHRLDTSEVTPEVVAEFQAKWNGLFR